MSIDHNKLEKWIKGCLYRERVGGGYVNKFSLKHLVPGGAGGSKTSEVDAWEVPEQHREADGVIEDLASTIDTAAANHTEGLGGLQKFGLYAYMKGSDVHVAHTVFRLSAVHDEDESPIDSEPANAQGLVMQFMRHNEAQARTISLSVDKVLRVLERTVERQAGHIETMEEQRIHSLEAIEALASRKQERDVELLESQAKLDRNDKLIGKLLPLASAVANRMIGSKILPGEKHPADEMLKDFAESITPEQFENIRKNLNPDQLLLLMEMMQASQKKSADAEEEAAKK